MIHQTNIQHYNYNIINHDLSNVSFAVHKCFICFMTANPCWSGRAEDSGEAYTLLSLSANWGSPELGSR